MIETKTNFKVKYEITYKDDSTEGEIEISKEWIQNKLDEEKIWVPTSDEFPIWDDDYVTQINDICLPIEYETHDSLENVPTENDCWEESLKKVFLEFVNMIKEDIYKKEISKIKK